MTRQRHESTVQTMVKLTFGAFELLDELSQLPLLNLALFNRVLLCIKQTRRKMVKTEQQQKKTAWRKKKKKKKKKKKIVRPSFS